LFFYDVSIALASYPTGEIASGDRCPERGEIASGHRRAQPPGEPLGGSLQASLVPMNVHTAARYQAPRIGHNTAFERRHAQERVLRVGAPTADARPHRSPSGVSCRGACPRSGAGRGIRCVVTSAHHPAEPSVPAASQLITR
jgi:hypothetical protein